MQVKYCNLKSEEQQKQQNLLKRIQELESNISSKQEEEEVKLEFHNRDKLRETMMNWNDFEEDFEECDETIETDQKAVINKLEIEVQKKAAELEDIEKENLDSRLVMMNEYREQLKMIDFYKELIHTQISKGGLEQLRIQSNWSDKDNEFKVPVFFAKNGKINPLKLPKHEIMIKLTELYDSRTLKIKTDYLVKEMELTLDLEKEETQSVNEELYKNQRIDASFYRSKSDLIDEQSKKDKVNVSFLKEKGPYKTKQHKLPPVKTQK